MLDLSAIKVVQKEWGTQVWLNDYEMLMVMRRGTRTSFHKHLKHTTLLFVLQGTVVVEDAEGTEVIVSAWIPTDFAHGIWAETDCVIFEQYVPVSLVDSLPHPIDDIERLEC